jgi:two-component system, OmpR family, sensor kinase
VLRSIRTRVTVLVFAITLAAVGFVVAYVVPTLEEQLREQKLESLAADARQLSGPIRERRFARVPDVERALSRAADRATARVTLLRIGSGTLGLRAEVVADSGETPPNELTFAVASTAARTRRTQTGRETSNEGPLAQAALPLRERDGSVNYVVVFSAPLADVEATVETVRRRVFIAGGIALLIALLAGALLAGALGRRIKRLERTARRVASGDLSGRFVVDRPDELGQLAVALNDMQRQLGQLDSARKRFIATASHELRTPIFSLSGFLELLQDEELDPDTREAFLTMVREQVDRLKKLATDLLDLSKLEAGALELRPEPTDLGTLARAVSDEFRPALARHESALTLRLGRDPVEADVDAERVAQIMRILLDNALTHTPAGTDMVVSAARHDGHVRLSVCDFGEGIGRQAVERIFEPFYTTDDAQGSGLGLAIARELAERMEGRLQVEALAGRTTFTLELPA